MSATVNTTEKIEAFLNSLDAKIEINDNLINYIDIENIDFSDAFNSIYDMVYDKGGFDIEIIYYANAIKYLQENDIPLLMEIPFDKEIASCYSIGEIYASNKEKWQNELTAMIKTIISNNGNSNN